MTLINWAYSQTGFGKPVSPAGENNKDVLKWSQLHTANYSIIFPQVQNGWN